jgi:hypothetical protein
VTDDTKFCPASMCPLFAANGSPWTGDYDAPCEREKCGWYHGGRCEGGDGARHQVNEVINNIRPLQIGVVRMKHRNVKARKFDCPNAHRCQWQMEAGEGLCPPRYALSKGIDPRSCAY